MNYVYRNRRKYFDYWIMMIQINMDKYIYGRNAANFCILFTYSIKITSKQMTQIHSWFLNHLCYFFAIFNLSIYNSIIFCNIKLRDNYFSHLIFLKPSKFLVNLAYFEIWKQMHFFLVYLWDFQHSRAKTLACRFEKVNCVGCASAFRFGGSSHSL